MPAPRLLPDNEVLKGLRAQGWTYQEIASEFGVSTHAVYLRLKEAKATAPKANHKNMIPWTVRREHTYAFPIQMLRLYARREKGEELAPVRVRMLDKWLRQVEDADVVVCYDPEMPPNPASPQVGGVYYSKRRPEDGDSLVRDVEAEAKHSE